MSPATPDPLEVFLDLMSRAGLETSVDGLMDAFWLALQPGLRLEFSATSPSPSPPASEARVEPAAAIPRPGVDNPGQSSGPDKPEVLPPEPAPVEPPVPGSDIFHTIAPETEKNTIPASPLRIPAGAALACKLPLTRALRPLRKWFRNPQTMLLNEEETVEETARANGILMPVLEPPSSVGTNSWWWLIP